MNLTRRKRIALELLGPPFIGAAPFIVALAGFAIWDTMTKNRPWKLPLETLQGIGMMLVFAYLCVGLQSIFFTAIMERQFARDLDPSSWQTVRLSALLGFCSGAILAVFAINDPKIMGGIVLIMGGLGLVVGFIMGLLIKRWSTEKQHTGENPL